MVEEVKKEATYSRPSVLSEWYRKKLGPKVAISNIDWVITSIKNKDKSSRYMIIEEKNTRTFDNLYIGLGEARSLKEVKEDIAKETIPIFVIFIKNGNISEGVYLYEFKTSEIDNEKNWVKLGDSWYVNVKKYSEYLAENDLISRIKTTIKVS